MGYFSCNAESAIAICDPRICDRPVRKKSKSKSKSIHKSIEFRNFFYDDLIAATNGFAADYFLGKGSHGSVYKAVLDDGNLIAAVKRTNSAANNITGTHGIQNNNCTNCNNSPADNEIEILSRVQNPRLVNLLGFCVDPRENKLLVVEYMANGSLDQLLHSTSSRPPVWTKRVRFALQIAKAVHSLHSSNPPVIHRDIKSSNVLIDEDGNARLSDFGLALRGHVEDVRVKCTPPAGTLGYLDPGYLAPGDLSTKSDVFSFGILLLEIITGRHAIDLNYSPPSVVDWAVPMIKHGKYSEISDRRVGSLNDPSVIRTLAVLAARCVRSTVDKRPDMAEVVECLKIAKKKTHRPPVWGHLRQRVRRVDNKPDDFPISETDGGGGEEVVRNNSRRCGNRRNKKVSNVTSVEYKTGWKNGDRVIRSKSIGALLDLNQDDDTSLLKKKRTGLTVRLIKSRSMGVLRSSRLLIDEKKVKKGRNVNLREIDISKLFITTSSSSSRRSGNYEERELIEKPLVSILGT